MAPTTTPFGSTALAVPMPPLTPPERAPAPAPTLPICTGPLFAARQAFVPNEASGRKLNGAQRPGSKRIADGTIGTIAPFATGVPMPWLSRHVMTPSAAARPYALPPLSTTACAVPTAFSDFSRSVSRVPGAPPRCVTPAVAPPRAMMAVVPVMPPAPLVAV